MDALVAGQQDEVRCLVHEPAVLAGLDPFRRIPARVRPLVNPGDDLELEPENFLTDGRKDFRRPARARDQQFLGLQILQALNRRGVPHDGGLDLAQWAADPLEFARIELGAIG